MEKVFRRLVQVFDRLENFFAFQAHKLPKTLRHVRETGSAASPQMDDATLLAVYCLKTNGLTFDFVTFLGIVEMERIRRGLQKSRVIVYAPPEFFIYQWQRLKVFNNMDGIPLIRAKREHVLAYVHKLADTARIFSGTMKCEVVGERREFFDKVLSHSNVIPNPRWIGTFPNMTQYKVYTALKHSFNDGKDVVMSCRSYRMGTWLSERLGGEKLVATVNFRNQGYSTGRNANLGDWEEFFSHPFIKKHFHFIVFNDAETPVVLSDTECITFCDRYIHDNFRRFKMILSVGLHIGNDSGSASIVSLADIPYLFLGALNWRERIPHLDRERYSMEGDLLFYDRDKRYRFVSFRQGRILEDIRLLLESISLCPQILYRYPEGFRRKLADVLMDWP